MREGEWRREGRDTGDREEEVRRGEDVGRGKK